MSSYPRHADGFAPDARQTLDELLKEWGLALTKALFVANSKLWERYKALPSGDALTLAFAPKAQALAENPWEYAWDLAAKAPLAGPALPTTRVPSALFPTFSVPLPAG